MLDNKSSLPNHIVRVDLFWQLVTHSVSDQEHKLVDTEALLPKETQA